MFEKPVVLVDMDGVIADLDAEVQACLTERHPEIEKHPRTTFQYMQNRELTDIIMSEPGFFARLPLEPYAIEGMQRIVDLGYQPQICTSLWRSNPTCEVEKRQWLERIVVPHLGKHILDSAVITSDKFAVPGIAIIEDRPVLPRASEATWTHVIFDKPWNQERPGFRLHGWLDENLDMILSQLSQTVGG